MLTAADTGPLAIFSEQFVPHVQFSSKGLGGETEIPQPETVPVDTLSVNAAAAATAIVTVSILSELHTTPVLGAFGRLRYFP